MVTIETGVPMEALPFVRRVTQHAYHAGASLVTTIWADEASTRARFQPATKPLLDWALGHLAQSVYETMWGPAEFVCTGSLRSLDLVPVLPHLKVPTLYVSGEYDECTPDASHYFASHMPNASVQTIPGAAHLTTIDAPDEMNRITRRFINVHDRR